MKMGVSSSVANIPSELNERNRKTTEFMVLRIIGSNPGITFTSLRADFGAKIYKLQRIDSNFIAVFPGESLIDFVETLERFGFVRAKHKGVNNKRLFITPDGRVAFSKVSLGISVAARQIFQ